jgi:hypothetical protein
MSSRASVTSSAAPSSSHVDSPMSRQKKSFKGVLLKRIDLADAKATGLAAAFALDPQPSDLREHVSAELEKRWLALDEFFRLNSDAPDIWQQRARALIQYQYGIGANDPNWWGRLTCVLAEAHIPGFSLKQPARKKHGAPPEWTLERLAQLFADVEFLRSKTRKSIRYICKQLPSRKGYVQRWGQYRGKQEALRKAYTRANNLKSFEFTIVLCCSAARIGMPRDDLIKAAVAEHALKV